MPQELWGSHSAGAEGGWQQHQVAAFWQQHPATGVDRWVHQGEAGEGVCTWPSCLTCVRAWKWEGAAGDAGTGLGLPAQVCQPLLRSKWGRGRGTCWLVSRPQEQSAPRFQSKLRHIRGQVDVAIAQFVYLQNRSKFPTHLTVRVGTR